MQTPQPSALSAIIVSAHRLARLSAHLTGSTTSPAVWRTLSILHTDGPLRVGALAVASRVSQPTMTKILSGLTDDGLISRVTDAEDSRATLVAVTRAGRAVRDAHVALIDRSLAPLFDDLTPEESATLEAAARILQSRSESAVAAALTPIPAAADPTPAPAPAPAQARNRKEQFA